MVQDILESLVAQRVLRLASRDECLKTSGELRARLHACGPQVAIKAIIGCYVCVRISLSLTVVDYRG